jgi:hypothetical protein
VFNIQPGGPLGNGCPLRRGLSLTLFAASRTQSERERSEYPSNASDSNKRTWIAHFMLNA